MGITNSALNNLKNNEHLNKFASNQHIPVGDSFWNEMLSFSFTKSIRTLEETRVLEDSVSPLLNSLLSHNLNSNNLGSLVKIFISKSAALKDELNKEARCCAKHLVQTLTEENVLKHFLARKDGKEGNETGVEVMESLINNLVSVLVDIPLSDSTYALHCECINLLVVLLSVQMYSVKPASKSVIYRCIMKKCAIHSLLLTKCLINNFIRQDLPPREDGGSVILDLASGLWSALTLGYGKNNNDETLKPVLAKLSLILLLILTYHCTTDSNPYREALFNCCDLQVDSIGVAGLVSGFKMNFNQLFSTLCATQNEDQSTLILYLLLYKNPSFRAFLISRTSQLDDLTIPILKILYHSGEKTSHHIYMAVIILLILSEDQLFNESIHDITLKNITWYSERTLPEISLGGLIILMIIRTVQYNISRTRDKFLHTNLLATLANMSNHFRRLSPYVCQRLVTLFEKISKKLHKILNSQNAVNGSGGDSGEKLSDKDTDVASTVGPLDQDTSIYEEVLRMLLEIMNSTLSSQLIHNPNLVYTLLYNRHVFEPFQSHPSFQDIVMNFDTVLTYFSNRIAAAEDSNTSVAQVYEIIQNCSLQWPADKMKKFPELKFRYVEDDQPEEFFIPYVWSIVYKSSGIYFNTQNILLFNPHRNVI